MLDGYEKTGENAPGYRPKIIAGSDAEAAHLREIIPPGTIIEVERVRTDIVEVTPKIRRGGEGLSSETVPREAQAEELARRMLDAGPRPI